MSTTTSNGHSSATTTSTSNLTQRTGTTPSTNSSSTPLQPLPPAHVFQSTDTPLLPTTPVYKAHGDIPNTPLAVSLISTVLGGIMFTSFTLAFLVLLGWIDLEAQGWGAWARPQLGIYLGCLAGFHLMEFWVTAGWNKDRLSVDGKFTCLSQDLRQGPTERKEELTTHILPHTGPLCRSSSLTPQPSC